MTGFGGDGVPGTYTLPPDPTNTSRIIPYAFRGCVQDGPFANYILKMGPGLLNTEHCLTRGLNSTFTPYLTSSAVAQTLTYPTFDEFRVQLEGFLTPTFYPGAHIAGHSSAGGEMSNFFSSPGGQLLQTHLLIPKTYLFFPPVDPTFFLHHANVDRIWWIWQQLSPSHFYEIGGPTSIYQPTGNLTYDFPLLMGDLGPTVSVGDVMNIQNRANCFTYV